MFKNATFTQDEKSQIMGVIGKSVGQDSIAFTMNSHLLPRETIIKNDNNVQQKIYELDWNPILKRNIVTKILLVVRDVTELRGLEMSSEKQRQELEIIEEVISIPANKFNLMIAACYRFIKDSREIIHQQTSFELETIQRLFRNMHTLKGLGRSCNLRTLYEAAHNAEQFYSDSIGTKSWQPSLLLEALDKTQQIIDRYQQTSLETLGRSPEDGNRLSIDRQSFQHNLLRLSNVDLSGLSADGKAEITSVKQLLNDLAVSSLEQILSVQINAAAGLAEASGKAGPVFVFDDPGFSINLVPHQLISNVFTHLIRNSIDHGLELTQERLDCGKQERGTLTIVLEEINNQLEIKFNDDGRGLNLTTVYQSALEKGLINEGDKVTPEQIVNFIFASGFSAAKQVPDISGRGVGLDAVKSFLESHDCSIEVRIFSPNTTFDPEAVFDPNKVELIFSVVEFVVMLPRKFFQSRPGQSISLPERRKKERPFSSGNKK